MSLKFRIVFSCACALLAALACVAYGERAREEAERLNSDVRARYGGEVVSLVVAQEALEAGDVISNSNVSEREWVATLAPEGAITSLDDVLGKQVAIPLAKGAPLSELTFRENGSAAEVPAGHVAVTIPITDKLGIPRSIARGTRVEAYRIDGAGTSALASGMQVISSPEYQGSLSSQAEVTLSVKPEDVAGVLSASAAGDLRLVLPADDVADAASDAAEAQGAPAAVEAAAAAAPAEVAAPAEAVTATAEPAAEAGGQDTEAFIEGDDAA